MRRWIAVGIVVAASTAHAHLGHVVLRAERYLKFDAEPDGVRLVVSLTLGPQETMRIAEAADANQDGEITAQEADAYMLQWGEGLLTDLPVFVDGEPVEVQWGEPFYDPIGPIRPVPGAVEMVAHVPLSGGRHRVSMDDKMRVEAFDRTDVAFEGQPGTTTVFSGAGDEPNEWVRGLAYGPNNAPERLTIVVDQAGITKGTWWALAGAGAFVVVLALAFVARRRQAS